MDHSHTHDPQLHGTEEEQLANYSAVSMLAIVALVLGLASPLALVGPGMWFVPVLGIGVGVAALWRINHSDSTLVGRSAAMIGLMLALCFAAWAPTQYLVRAKMINQQAKVAAERWLELVRSGDLQMAHQSMLSIGDRAPTGQSLDIFYVNTPRASEQLDEFGAKAFVVRLQEDPTLDVTFLGTTRLHQEGRDYAILRYLLAGSTAADPPLLIEMQMHRIERHAPGRTYWVVNRAEVVAGEE